MFNSELEEIVSQRSKLALSMTTLMTKSTTAFLVWYQLSDKFPITYRLVRALEVLPYTTASVERKFSQMNDIKTKKRNKLGLSQLSHILWQNNSRRKKFH